MRHNRWKKEEIELLKAHYKNMGKSKLANLLSNHTWGSIQQKAYEFKLFRNYVDFPIHKVELTEFELGYICGFIDGEGTITIFKRGKRSGTFRPTIHIANTNLEVLEWIRRILNLGYIYGAVKKVGKRQKTVWCLYIMAQAEIYALLKRVTPHLILKKRQAELVKQFLEIRMQSRQSMHRLNPPFSEREFEIQEEIKNLNQRGKP